MDVRAEKRQVQKMDDELGKEPPPSRSLGRYDTTIKVLNQHMRNPARETEHAKH